jgi:hypothetical protein
VAKIFVSVAMATQHRYGVKSVKQKEGKMKDKFPGTRNKCLSGPRPCPWLRCAYHVFWLRHNLSGRSDTKTQGGKELSAQTILNRYATDEEIIDEIWLYPETCVLDVYDRGPNTLEQVGQVMGLTRERVRQIQDKKAMEKLKGQRRRRMLQDFVK